jgi:quercetin dioxygenase-like cupin family protein
LINKPFTIPIITTDENGISIFSEVDFDVTQRGGLFLTQQIASKNFRLRKSDVGYTTDFHMSGDPTYIIILKGVLKIELQNGEYKLFSKGESFIAQDNIPQGVVFNSRIHGHKASVEGNDSLEAIHIKL